jgi:hypothetical protein
MTEFRTTATHDGRAVPMPTVNAACCDSPLLRTLKIAYKERETESCVVDDADLRDRIAADARASAAPSEDAIREREREAFKQGVIAERGSISGVAWQVERDRLYPAPRPVYAAPVRLSDGSTFGQVGPDAFKFVHRKSTMRFSAQFWRSQNVFTPKDGALVLAVLDGVEETR